MINEANSIVTLFPVNTRHRHNMMVNTYRHLQDVILGGDFNAGCTYVTGKEWLSVRLKHDARFLWIIGDDADTTVGSTYCPYDRYECL